MLRFLIFFVINLSFVFGDRVVETNVGSIRGYLSEDGYYQYLGIPYGDVDPENPFGISTPRAPFPSSSTYDANSDAVHCPQLPTANGTVTGVTDCLTLNIYVPTTATSSSNLPVLIWTYGGYFHNGYASTSQTNPKFLIPHGIIFVSYNHRTGPYGFMCLNTARVPGNQGLRDQYLAIKWVKDNIQAFGGNSDQITFAGHSAGGHSVDLHFIAEKERLFNKAIIMSGSALATTLLYPPDRAAPVKLAQNLGYQGNNTAAALRFLAQREPKEVMTAADVLDLYYKPCVERIYEGVEPFISKQWINASVPKAAGVPILIGTTEFERAMAHLNEEPEHFEYLDIVNDRLIQTLDLDNTTLPRMELYVRRFYNGDNSMSPENVWNIINFDSDYTYNYPVQRSIRKFLDSGAQNIFYYMFSYIGGRNGNDGNVASHGSDIRYIFDRFDAPVQVTEEDQLMIDRMTTLWTNFIKFSNPTPQTTDLLPVSWLSLTNETYNYLRIDTNLTLQRRPNHRRMAFLELFYRLNENYQKIFEPTDAYEEEEDDGSSATVRSAAFSTIVLLLTLLLVLNH